MRFLLVGLVCLFVGVFMLLSAPAYAQAAGAGAVITWMDNSNNEDGFKLERKTSATGTYAEIGRTGINAATYSDANLLYTTTYCYRVRAFNAAGDSAYSPEGCATTKADPIPAKPGTVTVTPQ